MKNFYNKSIVDIEKELKTNVQYGLKNDDIGIVREKYGLNELEKGKKKNIFIKFLEQFKDFMIIVLIIAAIISGVINRINGEGMADTVIIMIVIITNAIIGVFQENRAEKSMQALQKLNSHIAKVIRSGQIQTVASKELLPGDLVILETGDYVPADLRIIESRSLKTQESSLTGESISVEKFSNIIEKEDVGIADRKNMAFSSTLVTYGRGKGIVVETGMNTEVGKIAQIINNTKKEETPLQQKLNRLGKTLGIGALAICLIIFIIGLIYGKEPLEMFMTAVSLAVAAIPEGLAAVSTIVLAIGMQRMVKKHAIIKKLPAVETLGSTTVICTDKTGTLTQNKMTVTEIYIDNNIIKLSEKNSISINNSKNIQKEDLKKLVYTSMLCNDTKVGIDNKLSGDPTETALVDMGFRLEFDPSKFDECPRIGEIPFDSERKLMTTINKVGDKYIVYTKGGIDELLNRCSAFLIEGEIKKESQEIKNEIDKNNDKMAKKALRVLAMAYKELDYIPNEEEIKSLEENLIFIGMVGMIDPPRKEAKEAVKKCRMAGIKTVMITGDHKTTAMAIAKELGILEKEEEAITGSDLEKMSDEDLQRNVKKYSVYARVSPEHKVRIVKAWQSYGEVVAMTGDGVNDAPALKTSDIGCAMGMVGTDVAKESADVILTDDNFATIVDSVEEGRRIYDNILKVIQFLLSSNIGEIVVLFLSILIAPILSSKFGIEINQIEIFLVVQLLWINLITDSLPALALATDPAEKDIMKRKPNRNKGIFTKGMIWRIIYQGIMIGIITLVAFILGLSSNDSILLSMREKYPQLTIPEIKLEIGQTMAFIVIAFAELIHIFNIRNNKKSIFKTGIGGNKTLILSILASSLLMLIVLAIPNLRNLFGIIMLPTEKIIECVILIFLPIIIVEIMKLLKLNYSKDEYKI